MFKIIVPILFLIVLLGSCKSDYSNPHIIIHTEMGDIEVELYPKQAHKTVGAFLSYVDSGYYNNSSFYRVLLNEGLTSESSTGIIQGGIWLTNDSKHPNLKGIDHESTKLTGLSHTSGTISLARTGIGTGNTEFFICIGNQTQFDYGNLNMGDSAGFAAFGNVFKGMDIVRKIQSQKAAGENFNKKITITSIEML